MKEKSPSNHLEIIRHSASHVLAAAVLEMFPSAKLGIGPAIENGFYYDFDLPRTLIPEDLEILEEKMKGIIQSNHPFEQKLIPADEAKELFKKMNQPYKVELIEDLIQQGNQQVSVYKSGNLVDLCAGPHLESTGELSFQSLKLTKVSGAYWRGDEHRDQLQRIYGVAFADKKALRVYLKNQEEAEKRNHRKIGKEMELFSNFQEIGQGLPVWLPNGYAMRKALEDYMLKMEDYYGYQHIITPHINKKELFEISGHLGFYNDSMYNPIEIDDETFYLKPMNCPATMMVYRMKPRSYRDLPMKIGEFGTVYRYEKSGELHGIQRVRGFTQNDAHIFCTKESLKEQFIEVLEMLEKFYKDLGFTNYSYRLSLRDDKKDKYVGEEARWEQAQEIMREVLKERKASFAEEEGEAAFYGPKLDVQAVNVFGKEDTISTIQVDFNLPERFDLNFINEQGEKERPFVIHRALIGSFERFFAFLIEFYAGKFPTWLAPVQASILPIGEKFNDYGKKILLELKKSGVRTQLDASDNSLGKKIAENTRQKTPYLLIVGEKEVADNTVTIRQRDSKKQETLSLKKFIEKIQEESH